MACRISCHSCQQCCTTGRLLQCGSRCGSGNHTQTTQQSHQSPCTLDQSTRTPDSARPTARHVHWLQHLLLCTQRSSARFVPHPADSVARTGIQQHQSNESAHFCNRQGLAAVLNTLNVLADCQTASRQSYASFRQSYICASCLQSAHYTRLTALACCRHSAAQQWHVAAASEPLVHCDMDNINCRTPQLIRRDAPGQPFQGGHSNESSSPHERTSGLLAQANHGCHLTCWNAWHSARAPNAHACLKPECHTIFEHTMDAFDALLDRRAS